MTILPPLPPRPISFGARLRNWFLTGLVIAGPLALTAWLVWWFVGSVDHFVRPLLPDRFWPDSYLPVKVPGTGVVLAVLFLTLLGFLAANILGRSLLRLGESILSRMPIIRSIYKSLKQIFETIFSSNGTSFRKVGLVEYPVKGAWSVVFLSATPSPTIREHLPKEVEYASVFLCCAPTVSTGFFFYVPAADIVELPISVEEGIKLVMSCGLIQPESQAKLAALAAEAKARKIAAE